MSNSIMDLFKKERHIVIDKYHRDIKFVEKDEEYGSSYYFPSFIQTEVDDGSITIILDKPLHVRGGVHTELDINSKCDLHVLGSIRSNYESISVSGDLETFYNSEAPNLLGEDPGHISAEKDLIVNGNVELAGGITVGRNVKIDGDLNVESDIDVGGDFVVGGDCEIGGDLSVWGDLNINGSLKSNSSGSFHHNKSKFYVTVNGSIYIGGKVLLPGSIVGNKKIEIKGEIRPDAKITLLEDVFLDQNTKAKIIMTQRSKDEGEIFLCESEEHIQEYYSKIIKDLGLEYKVVKTGYELFEELSKSRCKILLTNLLLSGPIDGLEIIKTIRESLELNFPIIVLTDMTGEKFKTKAFKLGANDLLRRIEIEIDNEKLTEVIEKELTTNPS